MIRTSRLFAVVLLATGLLAMNTLMAIDASKVPKKKQTKPGLYMTAIEANAHMKKQGAKTLFVDIRDPAELQTVGMPTNADANVPFKRINLKKWNNKKGKFGMKVNPGFVQEVGLRLKAKGLKKTDTVIAICGSGKRVPKAVNALAKSGYTKVYAVVDGYKGWKKGKLPTTRKMEKTKMHGNPK